MGNFQKLLGRKVCITCGSDKIEPAFLIEKDGVPPREEGHNIGYSHIVLVCCKACNGGHIERLDHDCFDYEAVYDQYEWYLLGTDDCKGLIKFLKGCPKPMSGDCDCWIHDILRSFITPLPRSSWGWAFEDAKHIHKVSLEWKGDLPQFIYKEGPT